MSERRILRSKSHAKGVKEGKIVETANSLPVSEFFDQYFPPEARKPLEEACGQQLPALAPAFHDAEAIEHVGLLDACLNLVEETSAADYNKSETKWSPSKKKSEMRLPDMKYITLLNSKSSELDNSAAVPVIGFVSFMITYEDSQEVAYVYELHFGEQWRRFGFGKKLMIAVEEIGRQVGVKKTMLTVFRANTGATAFYGRLGYTEDDFSPRPKKLRNGTAKESTYTILSKFL